MSAAEGAGGAGAGTSQPLSTAAKEAREAEVYDRQIRLWGVEAQRRLAKSRVLIAGMDALACEVRAATEHRLAVCVLTPSAVRCARTSCCLASTSQSRTQLSSLKKTSLPSFS